MGERGVVGDADDNSRVARMFGINLFEAKKALGAESPLAYFMESKQASGKKVKLKGGYVYIFFSTSDRCITCYKIPDEYLEEYRQIEWIERKHKNDYKKFKRRK